MLTIVLLAQSCYTQPAKTPVHEIGDCEPNLFVTDSITDTVQCNFLAMYPDRVQDFVYTEGIFAIEYSDSDFFDFDKMAIEDEFYKYCSFIVIECSKKDFFDYLEWYSSIPEDEDYSKFSGNNNYYIKEIVTPVKGGKNYRYYLQHKN